MYSVLSKKPLRKPSQTKVSRSPLLSDSRGQVSSTAPGCHSTKRCIPRHQKWAAHCLGEVQPTTGHVLLTTAVPQLGKRKVQDTGPAAGLRRWPRPASTSWSGFWLLALSQSEQKHDPEETTSQVLVFRPVQRSLPCLGKKGLEPRGCGWAVLLVLGFFNYSQGCSSIFNWTYPALSLEDYHLCHFGTLGKLGSAGKETAAAAALKVQLGTERLGCRCCSLAQLGALGRCVSTSTVLTYPCF